MKTWNVTKKWKMYEVIYTWLDYLTICTCISYHICTQNICNTIHQLKARQEYFNFFPANSFTSLCRYFSHERFKFTLFWITDPFMFWSVYLSCLVDFPFITLSELWHRYLCVFRCSGVIFPEWYIVPRESPNNSVATFLLCNIQKV